MNTLSTHVLDQVHGRPAIDLAVTLERREGVNWIRVDSGATNGDGRIPRIGGELPAGIYRLRFATGPWWARRDTATIYPYVDIVFDLPPDGGHFHLPILLSPFAYSTYRGS